MYQQSTNLPMGVFNRLLRDFDNIGAIFSDKRSGQIKGKHSLPSTMFRGLSGGSTLLKLKTHMQEVPRLSIWNYMEAGKHESFFTHNFPISKNLESQVPYF